MLHKNAPIKAMIRSLEIGHKSGKSQGILKW